MRFRMLGWVLAMGCVAEGSVPSGSVVAVDDDGPAEDALGVDAVLFPEEPDATTGIALFYDTRARGGVSHEIRWRVDGALWPGLDGVARNRVPAEAVRRGEVWEAEIRAVGDGVAGPWTVLDTVVHNAPPNVSPALWPLDARPGEPLEVDVHVDDADGDDVEVLVAWFRDGEAVPDAPEAGETAPGEIWEAEVVADDGWDRSDPVRLSVVVR